MMTAHLAQAIGAAGRRVVRRRNAILLTVCTLSLGLGANGAVYSLLRGVFQAPLNVAEPTRLVAPHNRWPSGLYNQFSYSQFTIIHGLPAFGAVAASGALRLPVTMATGARYAQVCVVSDDYFRVVAPALAAGRYLVPGDSDAGGSPVAVIGSALWRTDLGGRRDVIGTTLKIARNSFTIVGVLAPGFVGTNLAQPTEVYVPLRAVQALAPELSSAFNAPSSEETGVPWLNLIARLHPGRSLEAAEASLNASLPATPWKESAAHGGSGKPSLRLLSAEQAALPVGTRAAAESFAWTIAILAVVVLTAALVGAVNIQLASSLPDAQQFAVRRALGATEQRLFLQVGVENLVFCFLAWGMSLGVTQLVVRILGGFRLPGGIPMTMEQSSSWRVILASAAAGVGIGLVTTAIGLWTLRRSMVVSLRSGDFGWDAKGRWLRPSDLLVVAQVTLSFVLLVGALIFQLSISSKLSVHLGFETRGVLVASFPEPDGATQQPPAISSKAAERIRQIPGVQHLTMASDYFGIGGMAAPRIAVDDRVVAVSPGVHVNFVGTDYFATTGVSLNAGRAIDGRDIAGAPKVAVINDALSRLLPTSQSRLGLTVTIPRGKIGAVTIIGIARDAKYLTLAESAQPCVYLPAAQYPTRPAPRNVIVRVPEGAVARASVSIRQAVAAVDPDLPVDVRSMDSLVGAELEPQTVGAALAAVFGVIAVLLAGVSVYSLVAVRMLARARELAIRVALGATPRRVSWVACATAVRLLAAGVAVGLLLAIMGANVLRAKVAGLTAPGVFVYLAVIAIVALAVGVGTAVPALRAARLDPMIALRRE